MRYIAIIISIFIALQVQAQSWEIGLNGGAAFYQGDLTEPRLAFDNGSLAYGLYLQRNLSKRSGIRFGYFGGEFGANDQDYDRFDECLWYPPLDFKTRFHQVNLRYDYQVLNNGKWSPYLFVGPGYTLLNGDMRTEDVNGLDGFYSGLKDFQNEEEQPTGLFTAHYGGGVNFFIADVLKIGVELSWNLPFNDYLDGVSNIRSNQDDDFYTMGMLNVAYLFGQEAEVEPSDRDGDGIVDSKDLCPDVAGVRKFDGCPDTDGDGVQDSEDDCPEEYGAKDNKGCPKVSEKIIEKVVQDTVRVQDTIRVIKEVVIEKEDQETLDYAAQNIQFETDSDRLTSASRGIMDEVADVLSRYSQYKVKIEGHTDNTGEADYNQGLSERRARACYNYLRDNGGISVDRMSYQGFGESSPIATNDTAAGRKLNRRVEFNLVAE